ncbi:MAG: hypothetical protein AAFU77_09035 [Myxococcota bacterium]
MRNAHLMLLALVLGCSSAESPSDSGSAPGDDLPTNPAPMDPDAPTDPNDPNDPNDPEDP